VRGAKGDGIAWISAWDTPLDAAEFVSALTSTVARRYADTTGKLPPVPPDKSGARRYDLRGRSIVIATREIGGRTVVSYVDVPQGANTAVVDLSKVTLH
jgi:hypothetical protein